MDLQPMPYYFIVKVDSDKQNERKEKIGNLYLHHTQVHMERNMQAGEIVSIGAAATKQFPEAQVGHTLLFHHFVESQNFLISSDGFNFYTVTASEYNGRRNETYGVFNGNEIIPHPDFVFIQKEEKVKEISADEFIEQNTKKVGSLILFDHWEESREEKENRAKRIVEEIKNQSKGKSMKDDVKVGLEEKQMEAEKITASLNKKEYREYPVAFAHPSLHAKENIYALSMAVQTIFDFNGKEYYVVQTKYTAATA